MSEPSEHITKFLVIFIIAVFCIKFAGDGGFFEAKSYKGKGYFVKAPIGWKIVKKKKGVALPQGVSIVQFVPKEIDPKIQNLDVYISIISKVMTTPIWIEDEFPLILTGLKNSGMNVIKDGEIKLDGKITPWILYEDQKNLTHKLEFFIATDNNMYYKISYCAKSNQFDQNRKSFEELRESFKFRFSLY